MTNVINLTPKIATDLLVRLGDNVRALGDLRPADILSAKLVYDSTREPLSPVDALTTLIGLLTLIRDETSALESSREAERESLSVQEPA